MGVERNTCGYGGAKFEPRERARPVVNPHGVASHYYHYEINYSPFKNTTYMHVTSILPGSLIDSKVRSSHLLINSQLSRRIVVLLVRVLSFSEILEWVVSLGALILAVAAFPIRRCACRGSERASRRWPLRRLPLAWRWTLMPLPGWRGPTDISRTSSIGHVVAVT